jgi:hypothetical protein
MLTNSTGDVHLHRQPISNHHPEGLCSGGCSAVYLLQSLSHLNPAWVARDSDEVIVWQASLLELNDLNISTQHWGGLSVGVLHVAGEC